MAACKRDLKKESFWRRMVRSQAGSGLKVRAWCRKHGVQEPSFYVWRRELARRDEEQPRPTFVPVHVTEAAPAHGEGRMEIVLAGGQRVRIRGRVDRQTLADVLAAMVSLGTGQPAFGSEAEARREVTTC